MSGPAPARSKSSRIARLALRVILVVIATVVVALLAALAYYWDDLKQAGASSPKSNVLILRAATLQLLADGFTGCPTVQQVLELNNEPWKSELAQETNGMDPWGAPYQILCDQGQVLVFSLGPDKQPGTADDITSVL
jgi:general secretion pathway protein G